MFTFHNENTSEPIAELSDKTLIISEVQDIVDILAETGSKGCSRVIIHEKNLTEDFFDLKTRMAGEILQKFSNYRVKLAIVGDFTRFKSKSLQDFIRESNRGNTIFFADSLEAAIKRLTVKNI